MDIGRTLPADIGRELLDELLASKSLIEAVGAVLSEGLMHLDERRRIVRFNAAAERILGYARLSVIGNDFANLLHESNTTDVFTELALTDPNVARLVFRDTRGEAVPVRVRYISIMRESDFEGWVLAFAAKERLEEIEQLKSELVSTVSHELKTPLASIKAYTATLRQNPALYETHRDEFLAVVEQEADRLSRLVEDMLLVTRVDTTQLLRRRVMVDLDRLLDDVCAEIHPDPVLHPIERKGTNVEISGDPERLRDIFRNLLENAVKYSPSGGIIAVIAHQANQRTEVEVRDRGIGIAREHLPYIFDRFYRAQDESTANVGGSGLGLYIVQALVRAHGGTIDVRSAPGHGTTFNLNLPVRA